MKYNITFDGQSAQIEAPMPITKGSFITLGDNTIHITSVHGNRAQGTKITLQTAKAI